MKKRYLIPAAALAVALVTTAGSCQETPSADRSDEAGGSDADNYSDTSDVTVYRNVDDAPNVISFCAGGVRFFSTLSSDGYKTPTLLAAPDDFQDCQR